MWETHIHHISINKDCFQNPNENCNFCSIVHSAVHGDDMRDKNQGISFIDVTYIGIPVCTITTYEGNTALKYV